MPEKKHNRATREKQATVKLVISTATITRESNIISTGRFREVWLNFYFFLSVGKLVMSLFTINICLPIGGIWIFRPMSIIQVLLHLLSFSLRSVGSRSNLTWILQSLTTNSLYIISLRCLFAQAVGEGNPNRHIYIYIYIISSCQRGLCLS